MVPQSRFYTGAHLGGEAKVDQEANDPRPEVEELMRRVERIRYARRSDQDNHHSSSAIPLIPGMALEEESDRTRRETFGDTWVLRLERTFKDLRCH